MLDSLHARCPCQSPEQYAECCLLKWLDDALVQVARNNNVAPGTAFSALSELSFSTADGRPIDPDTDPIDDSTRVEFKLDPLMRDALQIIERERLIAMPRAHPSTKGSVSAC